MFDSRRSLFRATGKGPFFIAIFIVPLAKKQPVIPSNIKQSVEIALGGQLQSTQPVSGGDTSQAYVLTSNSASYFLKINKATHAGKMFEAEAAGLVILASINAVRTPAVIDVGATEDGGFLLLEYCESGQRHPRFWEKFGAAMSELHRHSAPSFGLDHDNFIGSLPQQNCQHATWPDFYINERLLPQLETAKLGKNLQSVDYQQFEQLFKRLPELCPIEPPALVHGDFWSGNFLCDVTGMPVIFDPAVSYSHREMDLAMSRLFGGFERPFYNSYEAAWPLAPGFERRLPVYQLYYLLVHVNLFGGGYVRQVREALREIA